MKLKILDRLENAFHLGGGLSGLKLILGAALIVLSHEMMAVKDLIPLFPDSHALLRLAEILQHAIEVLSKYIGYLGDGFLGIGFLDKIRKFLILPK